MGPGGLLGFQILLPGAKTVRGGFDSHTSPPGLESPLLVWLRHSGGHFFGEGAPLKHKHWLITGVLCLMFWAAPGWAEDGLSEANLDRPYPEVGAPSPTRVMFQSLLLPGWGQVSNGSPLKAGLFAGVYGGFVGWAVAANQKKQDAVGSFNAAATPEEQARWQSDIDHYTEIRNSRIWLAGLTAVAAMADAFVDAHLRNFDDRMDADVAILPQPGGIAVHVRVPWGKPF